MKITKRQLRKFIRESFSSEDFKDVYNTARMAHVGQTRRDGSEYFSHPSEVRNITTRFYPRDRVAQLAALLHDSLEDAPGSTVSSAEEMEEFIKGSIQDRSSADEVIRVVRALTHEKGGDYLSYVVDLMGDIPTLRVKLSDMVHNLTDNPSPKQKAKYKSALDAIASKTGGAPPAGITNDHWNKLFSLTENKRTGKNSNLLREYVGEVLAQDMIILPPPPTLKERIKELEEISYQRNNQFNPPELQQDLDIGMTKLFNSVIKSNGYESCKPIIKKMKNEVKPIIKYHKNYFNSPRPNQIAEILGIDFDFDDLNSAKSPSYPSGHAAQAFYLAHNLSNEFPELREDFYILANMIAESRVDRGVHFPSDIEAGKLLASKLVGEI